MGLANIPAAPKKAMKVPAVITSNTFESIAIQVIRAKARERMICIRGDEIALVDSNFK